MGKTHLAPGFRFHPTDVELVRYYLKRKVMGKKLLADAIAEVDIYKFEPQDLPDKSYIRSGDLKWHFFCPRERKYSSGVRAKRATESGYWKTTGKERPVLCNNEVVGKIKTLVYHLGKSPRGERTDWVMHEYKLEDKALTEMNVPQDTYVVCVLFKKDGPGPRNGAQYGAPFKEEDWSDDEEEQTHLPATENPKNLPGPSKETSLVLTASHAPKDCVLGMISESCVSDLLPAVTTRLPPLSNAANTPISAPIQAPDNNDDDIYSLLDRFVADDEFLPFGEHTNNEIRTEGDFSGVREVPMSLEESIFSGLPDLGNMLNNIPTTPSYSYDHVENSEFYLELLDLTAPLTPLPTTSQNTNLNDPRISHLNQSSHHLMGFSAAADGGDDDPYGFAAAMGHGPNI